jgi:carbonic anhydrase
MRLFETIIDANHRAVAGDNSAGLHPADFADELPVIALTCIDPRLNPLFPNALALPAEQFIWLRNAGNIITAPLSSTMRSLALACAVKGGREIAIIGHTDCQICRTTTIVLLEKLKELGVERSRLPENINEFFGMFATERQNVIKACDIARQSPLIGPKIPVHGLMIDVGTGKLDWVVNGYETFHSPAAAQNEFAKFNPLGSFKDFEMGEMKFPESKIGDAAARTALSEINPPPAPKIQPLPTATVTQSPETTAEAVADYAKKHWPKAPGAPPKMPVPPPIRPRMTGRR